MKSRTKRILSLAFVAMLMFVLAAVAFAAEEPNVTDIMSTGMNSVKGDIMGILAIAVPILVAVAGAVVGIRFGMKYVKKLGSGG